MFCIQHTSKQGIRPLCCSQHPPETKWILSLYYVMSNGYFYVTLEHLNFQRKIFEPNAPGLPYPETSTKKTLRAFRFFARWTSPKWRCEKIRFFHSPVQCDHLMCAIPARPGLMESNQQVPPILIFGPCDAMIWRSVKKTLLAEYDIKKKNIPGIYLCIYNLYI